MFTGSKMKNKLITYNLMPVGKQIRNSIIWMIITSLFFINLITFNTESPQPERNNEAVFTINTLTNLEQNLSERNSRIKSLEKYHFNEITASLVSQNLITPDESEFINLAQGFLSIYSSTQNNHSLRSPPLA